MDSIKNNPTHLTKANGDNKSLMTTKHNHVQNSEDLVNVAEEDNIYEDNDNNEDSDAGQNESLYNAINAIRIIRRYLPKLKGSEAEYQYELHSGELQYIARCSTTGWISFHTYFNKMK